ncbi:MAG TPA: CapA family protein [Acidimicrobiia bacterium]|nr:CapA family protein [Acidimicrobiia bacterium]
MPPPSTPRARSDRRARRRRARARRLGLAVVAMTLAAGGGAFAIATRGSDRATRVAPRPAVSTSSTSTAPTTTTTLRDPRRGNGQPVSFAFGGDVHFEGALRSKLLGDPAGVLAPIAPVLSLADLAMVNLETAITERGTPYVKKYNFRAPAVALDALRAAGVDVTTVANNHGLDFGDEGMADTIAAAAEKQFPVLGIGNNLLEAYAPYRAEIKGQRIAVFGATDVLDGEYVTAWAATDTQGGLASAKEGNLGLLVGAIQNARVYSDTVVVFLHWGVERQGCPSPRQQEVAQVLTDAGADIVVGSHAHQLQGGGRFNTSFVDYGLGNFVFYNETGEYGRSGVLVVTATGRDIDSYQWVPARIRGGVATPLPAGAEADVEIAHWNELRACTGLAP